MLATTSLRNLAVDAAADALKAPGRDAVECRARAVRLVDAIMAAAVDAVRREGERRVRQEAGATRGART